MGNRKWWRIFNEIRVCVFFSSFLGLYSFLRNELWVAPSGVQKERIKPEDLFILDADGKVKHEPTNLKLSECTPLFLNAYLMREVRQSYYLFSFLVTNITFRQVLSYTATPKTQSFVLYFILMNLQSLESKWLKVNINYSHNTIIQNITNQYIETIFMSYIVYRLSTFFPSFDSYSKRN